MTNSCFAFAHKLPSLQKIHVDFDSVYTFKERSNRSPLSIHDLILLHCVADDLRSKLNSVH